MGNLMFRIVEAIEKKISVLNLFLITLGVSFLIIGMFLNAANIGGRYLFRAPVKSTYELTGLFMVLLISLGWPHTTEVKGHVSVDILVSRLPNSIRRILDIITLVLGLISFIALTWSSVLTGIQFNKLGQHSDLLEIPYLPIALLMALGAFLASVIIFFQFIHALESIFKGRN